MGTALQLLIKEENEKFVVVCLHSPQNVKLGIFRS